MKNHQNHDEISSFIKNLKNSIWLFGIAAWLFGIVDRAIAVIADRTFSAKYFVQLATAFVLFVSWVFLKPRQKL